MRLAALGVLVWGVWPAASAAQFTLEFTSSALLPATAVDQTGTSFGIGGVSGVTWLGGDSFAAVMDNSDKLVLFELTFEADGTIAGLTGIRGLSLATAGDHEGVAATGEDRVMISDEAAGRLSEFSLGDGMLVREIAPPAVFASRRNNLGLESLSFDPAMLWSANEEALSGDGPRASPEHGTVVRLLRVRVRDGFAIGQFAYEVEPMHGARFPFGNPGQSGLSDLVALPDGSVLALERSLALADPLFLTRIFLIGTAGAHDVSGLGALQDEVFTPVTKRLLYQGGHHNLEGLCLGPRLGPSLHVLVGVVDDGDPVSVGSVVAFRLGGLTACAADVNGDGQIDIGDLHDLHLIPRDLDGDGLADGRDRDCLAAHLRRHESLGVGPGG